MIANPPTPNGMDSTLWPSAHWLALVSSFMGSLRAFQARYTLQDCIDRGSFGQIYRGIAQDGSVVAVKVSTDPDAQKEAYFLNAVQHPHVVQMLDAWSSPWYTAIVMPLEQTSLHRFVRDAGSQRNPAQVWSICLQMCEGLACVHQAHIMHRDIHMGNVFITEKQGTVTAKLGDFGRACLVPSGGLSPSSIDYDPVVYCRAYGPPEIFCGSGSSLSKREGDVRYSPSTDCVYGTPADIWAMGCLIWCTSSGTTPFSSGQSDIAVIKHMVWRIGVPELALCTKLNWTLFGGELASHVVARWITLVPPGSLTNTLPKNVFDIVCLIFQYDPGHRPTVVNLAQRFREMAR